MLSKIKEGLLEYIDKHWLGIKRDPEVVELLRRAEEHSKTVSEPIATLCNLVREDDGSRFWFSGSAFGCGPYLIDSVTSEYFPLKYGVMLPRTDEGFNAIISIPMTTAEKALFTDAIDCLQQNMQDKEVSWEELRLERVGQKKREERQRLLSIYCPEVKNEDSL